MLRRAANAIRAESQALRAEAGQLRAPGAPPRPGDSGRADPSVLAELKPGQAEVLELVRNNRPGLLG